MLIQQAASVTLPAWQAEVEASKQALEQAEMTAVVAATECVNMQKIAQAGSQGDKKARRVLSLRAHNLKENLLKAKTDLKAQKAAVRQQAFQIGTCCWRSLNKDDKEYPLLWVITMLGASLDTLILPVSSSTLMIYVQH